jgi:hypothetical protein
MNRPEPVDLPVEAVVVGALRVALDVLALRTTVESDQPPAAGWT